MIPLVIFKPDPVVCNVAFVRLSSEVLLAKTRGSIVESLVFPILNVAPFSKFNLENALIVEVYSV
jgi:hypothetical protein